MQKTHFFLLLLFSSVIVWAQDPALSKDSIVANYYSQLNDGPYIFIETGQLIEKNIVKGKILERTLDVHTLDTIYHPEESIFENVEHIAALSDLHGQYDLTVELLQRNDIIDEQLNWTFGKGHLVVNGDIFDRGDKVNELLWMFYDLEKQAKKKGGRLHYVLGNHELMILRNDVRYVHRKYRLTGSLMKSNYDALYGENTVIGRWLRSKPTFVKINDILFVHAGISQSFLNRNDFDIKRLNAQIRGAIDKSKDELKATGFYSNFFVMDGPLWYRGYFDENLTPSDVSQIL